MSPFARAHTTHTTPSISLFSLSHSHTDSIDMEPQTTSENRPRLDSSSMPKSDAINRDRDNNVTMKDRETVTNTQQLQQAQQGGGAEKDGKEKDKGSKPYARLTVEVSVISLVCCV